jgi:hypothetical protein
MSTFRQLQLLCTCIQIDNTFMAQFPLLFYSPCWIPFASLLFPFTYLETLLNVIGSRPPCSQVAHKLIWASPPHSKIPTPWGFPELNMRPTKTTSQIRLTRSGTIMLHPLTVSKTVWQQITDKINRTFSRNEIMNSWRAISKIDLEC